jgi:hypothetical protein
VSAGINLAAELSELRTRFSPWSTPASWAAAAIVNLEVLALVDAGEYRGSDHIELEVLDRMVVTRGSRMSVFA